MRRLKFEPRVKVLTDKQIRAMSGPTESEVDKLLEPSRRTFLRKSAVGATAAGAAVLLGGGTAHAAGNLPNLFPDWNMNNFQEILADESAHVEIIQALLPDPDNHLHPQVRHMPKLRNLEMPTQRAFAQAAAAFENTGAGTYAGALFAIQQTDEYFPLAAGITTVEARHAGWINSILNEPLVPNFFPSDTSIPQSVALSHVDPFIENLNGTEPSFNPIHASDPNNFAILDFLLLLEYVETAFYQVNVAKFFGG
jgi:Ferritin-like domain